MTCREKILSNDFMDIVADLRLPPELQRGAEGFCEIEVEPDLFIDYIDRSRIPPLDVTDYVYHFIPKCFGLMLDGGGLPPSGAPFDSLSLISSGIRQIQLSPLELTGRGVILAFLDTGIRYENDVFRNSDGSTRILSIWDQTVQTGEAPEGLFFGTEYSREQINAALRSENPRELVETTDTNGHGTAIASAAAGSVLRGGLDFIGAAPDADIVVVKLKQAKQHLRDFYIIPEGAEAYAESDLILALKYIDGFARDLQRPVVTCFALGTNLSAHIQEGTSISRYMQRLMRRRSRAIVICGGNEGNAAHHYEGNTCRDDNTRREEVEIRVSAGSRGFMAELWGTVPGTYSIGIRSPGGEVIPRIMGRQGTRSQQYSFIYEKTRITVGYLLVEQYSGDQVIVMRFEDPTEGIWTVQVTGEGECAGRDFHMWLPIQDFLYADTYFLRPSPYTTLTVPSYTMDALTTSTYDDSNNSFYANSGRGFSRNGEVAPDFAAPGVNVSTILGKRTGSGIAAALTAGGAAQFMQWAVVEGNDPYVYSRDVRNYMIRGAERDTALVYPNREWGYGKLNMEGVFEVLAGI